MNGNGLELIDVLKQLTTNQLRFVAARLNTSTDKAAAENIGIPPQTAYNWQNKNNIDQAVQLAQMDTVEVAREQLRRLLLRAVEVVEEEMETGKPKRLDAAREVFDRGGLPPTQRQEISGPGGGAVTLTVVREDEPNRKTEEAAS